MTIVIECQYPISKELSADGIATPPGAEQSEQRRGGQQPIPRAVLWEARGDARSGLRGQMHRASCLVVVIAAIAAWNTVYLAKALETEA